jgi:type I restriction enzyme S subunit
MMCDLIYRLRTNGAVDNDFLCYWLLSDFGRMQIEVDARGSSMTMAKVSQGHIKSWIMVLPPKDEQLQIVSSIRSQHAKLGLLVERQELAIQLMQERRTALISAAVTGKIDVRNWQPNTSPQAIEPDLPMTAEQAAEAAPSHPCARGTGSPLNDVSE